MALPGFDGSDDSEVASSFAVVGQRLELDFGFFPRQIKGKTTIEIQPLTSKLKYVSLNCRQLRPTSARVEGRAASFTYSNLYERLTLYPGTGLEQHHFPKQRIERHATGIEEELVINIPPSVRILESRPSHGTAQDLVVNGTAAPGGVNGAGDTAFAPVKIEIEYTIDDFRDAVYFAGVEDGDSRYPHVYTRNSPFPGMASCLFPCVDDGTTKCAFDISIRYPRTVGDAFSKAPHLGSPSAAHVRANGSLEAGSVMSEGEEEYSDLSAEERALEMSVICSGEMTDDISDPNDATRKTASFICASPILPQHIGIVIGPFTHVDLSEYRDTQDDERLGSNAIRVHAFCLPGRAEEMRNSAMVLARTLDNFTERYQSYPFEKAYKLAFVDDLDCDVASTASFSICSSRLLFPETVWEPLEHTTRVLVHAVASQWIGVNVIPYRPSDRWIIVGGSWFMTELYLRELFGRNDHRFRQKLIADKVIQMDHKRPSLVMLGDYLDLDRGEEEFMELKALSVLSILHNRLVKQSGKNGVDRCLYRLLANARNEKLANGAISTEAFLDICEKVGHQKLDSFFNQWVYGSGCPQFECFPSFNKKKQVIQLTIRQTQTESTLSPEEHPLTAKDFLREAKERRRGFRHSSEATAFVGPMTIRIHEADGTPYEHIVDINSSNVKVEIQYNTKYKRLKRNRLAKERQAAAQGLDTGGDGQEDVTFYSLGDLFNTREEAEAWRIQDWSPEDEARMDQESYEWIRVDADFEWIAATHINDMPSYMYVSQLQQDKDVVAQAESIQYLATKEGHPILSSILVKTLMDARYFHRIRTMAADVLAASAKESLQWIGFFHLSKAFQELFCLPGSPMTRSNDFSDRASYFIQCAIPKAMSKIKGMDGRAPMFVKRFLLDIIRYNDNRGNEYSDDFYLATLMSALAESLALSKSTLNDPTLNLDEEAEEYYDFEKKAIEELNRHQRLDEWIPTYQNIYTVTALDCVLKLMNNKVGPLAPSEIVQYTRIGNAENVRLKAWECLVELGMVRRDDIMSYMLYEISTNPSPHFRAELLHTFGVFLGHVALGDVGIVDKPTEPANAGGLVIEQEEGTTNREAELKRRKLEGAMAALKEESAKHLTLRHSLENALHARSTSVRDVLELLEISSLLYTQKNYLPVKLRYPRYWRVEHVGAGRLRFSQTEKIRTATVRPKEKLKIKLSNPALARAPSQAHISLPTPAPLPVPVVAPILAPTPTHSVGTEAEPAGAVVPLSQQPTQQEPALDSESALKPASEALPTAESAIEASPALGSASEPSPAVKPALEASIPNPASEALPAPRPTPKSTSQLTPTPEPPAKKIKLSVPVVAAPKPKKTQTPAGNKTKKAGPSLILKLMLAPEKLARLDLADRGSARKRKAEDELQVGVPQAKRQASTDAVDELRRGVPVEPAQGSVDGQRALNKQTSLERIPGHNEEKPKLLLKVNFGKGKLPRTL